MNVTDLIQWLEGVAQYSPKKEVKYEGRTDYLNRHTLLAISIENKAIYEAGADAMYDALWKMAEESPTKTFTLGANVVNVFKANE